MFIVRTPQIESLRLARIRRFVDDMVAHIAAEYPTHYGRMGLVETRAFVERSIQAAGKMRIETMGSVGALTELRLIYGDNLERAPDREWARNILAHRTLPDYIRVGAVQDRLSERAGGRTLVAHEDVE